MLVGLFPVLLSSACTHVARHDVFIPSDPCCVGAERLPAWLVAMIEPAAPLIGSTVGRVAWRRGYFDDRARRHVLARLQPLDIVVVSSKGRLSGHTLPGFFGHVAIYLGTEDQLRTAGYWDDPAIGPHQDAIRAGNIFVEADQKGVHLSPSAIVLNTDRAAVLRPGLDAATRRRAASGYFRHVGSHFDDGDDSCLYCAELVRHVLPELRLPSRQIYGRDTTFPDEIAMRAIRRQGRLRLDTYVAAGPNGWEERSAEAARRDIEAYWRARETGRPF